MWRPSLVLEVIDAEFDFGTLPGGFEFLQGPLGRLIFLLRFQRLHQAVQETAVARALAQALAEYGLRLSCLTGSQECPAERFACRIVPGRRFIVNQCILQFDGTAPSLDGCGW